MPQSLSELSPASTRILFVRHGQIQANVDKRWHGWTDSSLTSTGQQQASRAGKHLKRRHPKIAAIYASPLERTRHTAQAIGDALSLDIQIADGLKEYGIGEWEGVRFEELRDQHKFFDRLKQDPNFAPKDGESMNDVSSRALDSVTTLAKKHRGETIVAVSHGAAMALILANLLHQDPYEWGRYFFENTGITELHVGDKTTLIDFNDTSHLDDLQI